ncbi:MAG: hypothetical protein IMHGJWDQ_000896 [Candidatus Fervidibacter sp.]
MAVIVAELVAVWLLTPPLPIAIIGAPRDIVVVCKMHHNMLWLMAVFSRRFPLHRSKSVWEVAHGGWHDGTAEGNAGMV